MRIIKHAREECFFKEINDKLFIYSKVKIINVQMESTIRGTVYLDIFYYE